jgi:photoactive yellow protein
MSAGALPDFDEPQLAQAVERLTEEQIDRLPFGAIRLDADGAVAFYSAAERRLSGFGDRPRLGLNFFAEIAPCMDTPAYRGRIERALGAGKLDLEFTHIGDFSDRERELTVRVQSAPAGGYWIFMRRDD